MAAIAVLDADVLIAYLNVSDASHAHALNRMRATVASGARRVVCAVNYSEVMVGPTRRGRERAAGMALDRLGVEVVPVDRALAQAAAMVRATTAIGLPDAYALATALAIERREPDTVVLETFDERLRRADQQLRPHLGPPKGA